MKQHLSTIAVCIVLVAISNKLNAQTSTYQPGQVLRVDFEGKHKMATLAPVDTTTYNAGPVLRIDFEGKHSMIDHQSSTNTIYQPGGVLRLDFEGRHRKNSNQ